MDELRPRIKLEIGETMVIWQDEFEAHGVHVGIIPPRLRHAPELAEVIARGKLHQLQYMIIPEPAKIAEEIERRTQLRSEGSMQPFAVLDKRTDQVVGMTSYMNIDAKHRGSRLVQPGIALQYRKPD